MPPVPKVIVKALPFCLLQPVMLERSVRSGIRMREDSVLSTEIVRKRKLVAAVLKAVIA